MITSRKLNTNKLQYLYFLHSPESFKHFSFVQKLRKLLGFDILFLQVSYRPIQYKKPSAEKKLAPNIGSFNGN